MGIFFILKNLRKMSDFCNKCAKRLGHSKPEIDVYKIFEKLEPGYFVSGQLCEGCGLIMVGHIDGKLKIQTPTSWWIDYEEIPDE